MRARNPRQLITIDLRYETPQVYAGTPERGEVLWGPVAEHWLRNIAFDPDLGVFRLRDGVEIPRGYKIKILGAVP